MYTTRRTNVAICFRLYPPLASIARDTVLLERLIHASYVLSVYLKQTLVINYNICMFHIRILKELREKGELNKADNF